MGHRNLRDIISMANKHLSNNMTLDTDSPGDSFCEPCVISKAKQASFQKESEHKDWDLLERIDIDECGPLPVASLQGERYFITFCERKSKKLSYLLHGKHEALDNFKSLKRRLENRTGKTINCLFGDNAGEFTSNKFKAFLERRVLSGDRRLLTALSRTDCRTRPSHSNGFSSFHALPWPASETILGSCGSDCDSHI